MKMSHVIFQVFAILQWSTIKKNDQNDLITYVQMAYFERKVQIRFDAELFNQIYNLY